MFDITGLSNRIDATIDDVEDFLMGLELHVEGSTPMGLDENEVLAFKRKKDGWHLYCRTARGEFRLVQASRARKVRALWCVQSLVADMRRTAETLSHHMEEAIDHARKVMRHG